MRKLQFVAVALCCLTLVVLICGANATFAQEVTASITGTVADQSGAAVAGANVIATSVERGTKFTAVSNDSGIYRISQIPVGNYDLRIEKTGFQTSLYPAFTLALNQVARIDVELKVGQVNQTIEVTGAAPVLKTEATQVDTIIDAATNEALPLATRNYVQLTLLAPGSITTNPGGFNNGDNTASGERPYINGNRNQSNNFLLDGMDNNQVSDNLLGYTPAPDAIQEFNLITNNAPAEFGNFEGGIVSATIKSGTNSYHGDAWEFFRNDILNANSWENNWGGQAKAKLRWNMFGGTFGGPIFKNKLFVFMDYQGQRFDHPSSPGTISVYNKAEQGGDFSQLLSLATPIQLYNPYCQSGTGPGTENACLAVTAANQARQPFVGDIIPASYISPVAAAYFASSLYPTTINNNLQHNATNTSASALDADQGDIKVDYVISDKDRVSGRFTRAFQNNPSTNTVLLLGNGYARAPIWNTVGDWSHTFSTNLANDARLGWSHITLDNGASFASSVGTFGQDIGIQNSNPGSLPGLLGLSIGNIVSGLGNADNAQLFDDKVWQVEDGLIYTHGRHTLKFGGQYWHQLLHTFYAGNSGEFGNMYFTNNYTATSGVCLDSTSTASCTATAPSGGEGMADFFLGLPSEFNRGNSSRKTWDQSSNIFAGYVQDTWRMTDRLTLNAGVRYEAHTPWIEANNQQVNFGLISGTVEFAGKNGNSRALYKGVYGGKDFQPRLGFAWTPAMLGGHTVLRGAFTISSYLEGTGTNLRLPTNPPFTPVELDTKYYNMALPTTTASDGIIVPPVTDPTCADLSCYNGAIIRLWDPNVQPAISDQWNLTIQHQFWGNTTFQIGYVGQRGTHLMVPMPYAQKVSLPNSACGAPPCTAPSLYLAGNPTLQNEVSQVSGTASVGNMMYNALQMVLQKQMSSGLQYQVAYTYSKCMTNNSGYYGSWGAQAAPASPYWQNLYDPKAEWAPCYYDSTHVLSAYAVYELPFGRGKMIGKNVNNALNNVVGGWTLSPIVSYYTGFPLAIQGNTDPTGTGSRGERGDCNAIIHAQGRVPVAGVGYQWFVNSNNAFTDAPTGQFGTCPAALGWLRGPGYANWDLSLQKDFHVTERFKLQFRSDFLNAFNHVNLNMPCGSYCSVGATMGQISSSQSPRNIQFALKLYY
jgi:Carboxypeptidase regulatory-like domain/TonB dependent receptor